jgi:hypothetical protein
LLNLNTRSFVFCSIVSLAFLSVSASVTVAVFFASELEGKELFLCVLLLFALPGGAGYVDRYPIAGEHMIERVKSPPPSCCNPPGRYKHFRKVPNALILRMANTVSAETPSLCGIFHKWEVAY